MRFVRLTFSLESGCYVLAAAVVSITLNLQARKTKAMPERYVEAVERFRLSA